MYALLGIDTVLRITAALLFLFVAVPALARRRPAVLDRMEWFWWCLAAGMTLITVAGQILTLLNVFSAGTLLLVAAIVILTVRARVSGRSVTSILLDLYRAVVLFSLNILEGRVNVRRRLRRGLRNLRRSIGPALSASRWTLAGWAFIVAAAAAVRLYRPFVTANLGFSDTYVHLYLIRLLEQGRQVDPAWGPYPRGMHFLLYAIHELTNVDPILLMNFFGPIAGVLMTLAVADAARRLAGRFTAALVAGVLFATMIGGGIQYFLFGGSIATADAGEARTFIATAYRDLPPTSGEFDVLLTVFQRQTATLPQELAIVLLFPAVMFLFAASRAHGRVDEEHSEDSTADARTDRQPTTDNRQPFWHLSGYLFCTSAIAATHPGVVIPLILLSGVTVLVTRRHVKEALIAGAIGVVLGSTWMLGYIAYPNTGSRNIESASGSSSAAAYYFPFLRTGDTARIVTYVAITPFLIACVAVALALLARRRSAPAWTSLAVLTFTLTHVASRFGLPEIVEVRRNASWLAMAVAILLGVAMAELMRVRAVRFVAAVILAVWLTTVPLSGVQDKLVNYSGYSATAYAVIRIQRKLEPFTWTLITYGQEFPMVLGKGFHMAAVDFLDRYDPEATSLDIPTRHVFIAVEKTPHPFQINTWASRFSRADIEQRLQTWCFLYQLNHKDMRIFLDDEHVRVYAIERTPPAQGRIGP
ncbi:MAG TPA: hypothetical protein VEK57_16955 [Thermoanaerobaculia bacterium]|nr:hypothetical protein [Thermoanaerobaculia bacterium]